MIKKFFGVDSYPTNNKLQHLQDNVGKQFLIGHNTVTAESVIAEGGFSVVMKVRSSSGHIFALKRIKVNSQNDLQIAQQEIDLLRSFNHKNILRYVDSSVCQYDNGIWEIKLLTGFCSNNLVNMMNCYLQQKRYFSENQVLVIFRDVVAALAYLHHRTPLIFHRDIKVDNVLISEANNFVLCDFGSATTKFMNPSKDGVTICQEEINRYTTLSYRSPEMIDLYSGQPIDLSSDIWALGCLLYYLCYLTLPFGENALKISSVQFTIPNFPKFSNNLVKLIGYILQQKGESRPDIYQVAALTASIMNTSCQVDNRNNRSVPSWESLPSPMVDDGNSQSQLSTSVPRSNSNGFSKPTTVATSVTPRQRPKPGQAPSSNCGNVLSSETNKDSLLINLDTQSQSTVNQAVHKSSPFHNVPSSEIRGSNSLNFDEFVKSGDSFSVQSTQRLCDNDRPDSGNLCNEFQLTDNQSQSGDDDLMNFSQPLPHQVAAAMAACSLGNSGKSQSVHDLAQRPPFNQYLNTGPTSCGLIFPNQTYGVNRLCHPGSGVMNDPRLQYHNSFNYYSPSYNPALLQPAYQYHQLVQPNPSPNSVISGQSSSSCMTPLQSGVSANPNFLSVQRHRRLVSDTSALHPAAPGIAMGRQAPPPVLTTNLETNSHKSHSRSYSTGNFVSTNTSNLIGVNASKKSNQLEDNAFGEEFDRLRSTF